MLHPRTKHELAIEDRAHFARASCQHKIRKTADCSTSMKDIEPEIEVHPDSIAEIPPGLIAETNAIPIKQAIDNRSTADQGSRRNDCNAVASMIVGIVGLASGTGLCLGPLAIFLGVLAKKNIRASEADVKGHGFAIAGITIGTISFVLCVIVGAYYL